MININDVRRIPVIGNKLYRVGQVQQIISQPCAPSPNIMVYAAFANLPMLIWSFVKPDPVDLVSDRFGMRHKRKRRNIFNVGDIDIGPPGDGKGGLRWVSFAGQKIAQRVGFYFCVLDATTDFLLNWVSMAYRFSGCEEPLSGYATCVNDTGFAWSAGGGDQQLGGGVASFSPGFFATGATIAMDQAGPHSVGCTVNFRPHSGNPKGTVSKVELEQQIGPSHSLNDVGLTNPDQGGNRTASLMLNHYGPGLPGTTYRVLVTASGGFIQVANWRMSLSGFPQQGTQPDP